VRYVDRLARTIQTGLGRTTAQWKGISLCGAAESAKLRMGTINISLPDEMIEELDGVVKEKHYASRSEIVRDALRTLFSEVEWTSRQAGTALAVVTMTFNVERRGVFEEINRLQHEYEDIVATILHNHMSGSCLEVILTRGDISRIRELAERLKAIRDIEVVRVTVA